MGILIFIFQFFFFIIPHKCRIISQQCGIFIKSERRISATCQLQYNRQALMVKDPYALTLKFTQDLGDGVECNFIGFVFSINIDRLFLFS